MYVKMFTIFPYFWTTESPYFWASQGWQPCIDYGINKIMFDFVTLLLLFSYSKLQFRNGNWMIMGYFLEVVFTIWFVTINYRYY